MHDFFQIGRGLALDSLISIPVFGSLISGLESVALNHGSGALELEVRSLWLGILDPVCILPADNVLQLGLA